MNPNNVVLLAVTLLIIADIIITYVSYIQSSKDITKLDKKLKDLVYDVAEQQGALRNTFEELEKQTSRIGTLRRQHNTLKKEFDSLVLKNAHAVKGEQDKPKVLPKKDK